MNLVGRDKESAIVREHVRGGKNLVVFGGEGVGKTALVTEAIRAEPGVLYCADTATLKSACECLLGQLKLTVPEADNVARKRAILKATDGRSCCFIFDHVGWVSPKLASFLDNVHESHPMIVVTRSVAWSDTGHLKMILWDFDKLELAPLTHESMLEVLRAQIRRLKLRPPDPAQFEADVMRIAGRNLPVVMELCRQAATGKYVFGKRFSTELVDLDRRIKELGLR
jgi:hypothetical protein